MNSGAADDPAPGAQRALRLAQGLDDPVFREPWEAHAFAMTVALHRAGLFTWREWADTLAQCIREAQEAGDPDVGDTYYHHWLAALERLVAVKGAGAPGEVQRFRDAWARAAERTPHGQPIELAAADFGQHGHVPH